MSEPAIRFEDGAAYERGMGRWSRLAGEIFVDWLAPPAGRRWVDVGCGSGAISELLYQRCAPAEVQGVDPSSAQLAFARERPGAKDAVFQIGDAMALPFANDRFDAAVMALVIFFVPDPAKGVAEMARVVRPGGTVAAYAWDMAGGGFPWDQVRAALRDVGIAPLSPPSVAASRMDALRDLWAGAGLRSVETREITVQRSFADFDEYWTMSTGAGSIRPTVAAMPRGDVERLKQLVRARLPVDASGRITYSARANAVKGYVVR
ncbi:MAG TPA: methyltransferase domain-containing protein [Acetobacteraceae bacterium]|jgi:SAM-dependent methyltransferase